MGCEWLAPFPFFHLISRIKDSAAPTEFKFLELGRHFVLLALFGGLGAMCELLWEKNTDNDEYTMWVYVICTICIAYLMIPWIMEIRRSYSQAPLCDSPMMRIRWLTSYELENFKETCQNFGHHFCRSLIGNMYNTSGHDNTNPIKSSLCLLHCVSIGLVIVLWYYLSGEDTAATSAHMRFKAHMQTTRNLAYVYVVVVPTFSAGIGDSGCEYTHKDSNMYRFYMLGLKFLMYANLVVILDPSAPYFWAIDHENEVWEIATIAGVTGVLFVMILVFWTAYSCFIYQSIDMARLSTCAYVEYPAFLSLCAMSAWCMTARLRNQTAIVADQSVGGDFMFFMCYVILTTVGIVNVPQRQHDYKSVSAVDKDANPFHFPKDKETIRINMSSARILTTEKTNVSSIRADHAQSAKISATVRSLDRLNQRSEEQWARLQAETDVSNYNGPAIAIGVFGPMLALSGLIGVLTGEVPTAVLYLPMGMFNILLMAFMYATLIIAALLHPLVRDNCMLVFFVFSEMTLVMQTSVVIVNFFDLLDEDGVGIFRALVNVIAGIASFTIAVITTLTAYIARPGDTAIPYLNAMPNDDNAITPVDNN